VARKSDQVRTALDNTEVAVWLRGQREFQRASNLVTFGRRRVVASPQLKPEPRTAEEAADELIGDARVSLIRQGFDVPFEEWRVGNWIGRRMSVVLLGPVSRTWKFKCVKALNEYYYSDAWERSLRLSRTFQPAIMAAAQALQVLQSNLAQLDALELASDYRGQGTISVLAKRLPNLAALTETLPVQRRDPRAPERLFVFRLQAANRFHTRKARAEAISQLMGLEGFRHEYDLRTIERLCAEFAGKGGRKSA
jgi:hypothetical protein